MIRRLFVAFLSTSLIVVQASAVPQGRSISIPCSPHLAELSGKPLAYEEEVEWDRPPKEAIALANERLPNTVAVIAAAPITQDEYQKVFTANVSTAKLTSAQASDVINIKQSLKSKLNKDSGDASFTAKQMKNVFGATDASFIIVIGHNEGGRLRLLDGSEVYLDEAVKAAWPKRVILLTCKSERFHRKNAPVASIKREVTYPQAFDTAAKVSDFIKNASGPVSIADVQAFVSRTETRAKGKRVAYFITTATCVAVSGIVLALIIRQLDPCDNKTNPGCS